MMKATVILAVLLSLGFSAYAEQAEVILTAVPCWEPVELDFGQPLPDIYLVEIEYSGFGGHQCILFSSMGHDETIFFPFAVPIDLGPGSAFFQAPMDEVYTSFQVLTLPEGETWESLSDGVGSIQFSPYHTGPQTNNNSIIACGYDPFTVETLTVTVSYGPTVPVALMSWGVLKAQYR